ncbi:hypothetical protein KIW84_041845 [Lathyrus oleraceus]|uniref:SGNH hydrolase-type esterase domain-containing protein n=1 Tax=Pisum sativum TaxID=3888 RepID=A0A9D4X9P3_PEA|nr:hypothetical protein KIW84_041845 [Pisum sativum]
MLGLKMKIARILHLIFLVGGKENLQNIMFFITWLDILAIPVSTVSSESTFGWSDSFSFYVTNKSQNQFNFQADVIVRGYCGYNTRWALFLLDHIFPLVRKPPVATTIFFGANDAALIGRTNERQHVPIPEYKQNLQKIVNHLKVHLSRLSFTFNLDHFLLITLSLIHCKK